MTLAAGQPGYRPTHGWALGWAALVTFSLPITWILFPAITAFLLWLLAWAKQILGIGSRFGEFGQVIGFVLGLGFTLGLVQARLLKPYLVNTRRMASYTIIGWCGAALAKSLITHLGAQSNLHGLPN